MLCRYIAFRQKTCKDSFIHHFLLVDLSWSSWFWKLYGGGSRWRRDCVSRTQTYKSAATPSNSMSLFTLFLWINTQGIKTMNQHTWNCVNKLTSIVFPKYPSVQHFPEHTGGGFPHRGMDEEMSNHLRSLCVYAGASLQHCLVSGSSIQLSTWTGWDKSIRPSWCPNHKHKLGSISWYSHGVCKHYGNSNVCTWNSRTANKVCVGEEKGWVTPEIWVHKI